MQVNFKFAFFVILTSQVLRLHCAVYELTVVIEAGKQECFYEVVEARGKVNVEFEVVFSSGSDYVTDFFVKDPKNKLIEKRENVDEASVEFVPLIRGEYQICFVNTANSNSEKRVAFEISVEDEKGNKYDEKEFELEMNSELENKYEIKLANIVEAFISTQINVMLIKREQDKSRSSESRDRHMLENKLKYVNFWSICQMSLMIVVAIIQVVMIKSLFDQDNVVHKILKKFQF